MRKVGIAVMALTGAILINSSTTNQAAAQAALYAKSPGLQGSIHGNATKVDWKIKRQWHDGCERWRWAKHRKWVCDHYNKCGWKYSGFYWEQCPKPPAPSHHKPRTY